MRKGLGLSTIVAMSAALATSSGFAETHRAATLPGSPAPSQMVALDDQDLKQVHGAGIDDDTLRQLGRGQLRQSGEDHRRQAASTQNTAALLAALELQANAGPRTAVMAVNAVNTAAQVGGTLIALTPVTMLAPIGLPLFGLPALPHNNH
ncbi:MAG: hypothetical protein HY019_06370 [Aquabacterium sp.]|uniref:hypothetical protein n=1 Tax=Aquabacterium sp. TaxID=1872578 RepID=UPI0025BCAC62|nr:hypothetical protein [Aquabacterium sp.]MBI3381613.1 hypothetical protein [Aquabacterium sp.]